jgi:hypothetical protein
MPSIIIVQGGGPTAVINQTLCGAILFNLELVRIDQKFGPQWRLCARQLALNPRRSFADRRGSVRLVLHVTPLGYRDRRTEEHEPLAKALELDRLSDHRWSWRRAVAEDAVTD